MAAVRGDRLRGLAVGAFLTPAWIVAVGIMTYYVVALAFVGVSPAGKMAEASLRFVGVLPALFIFAWAHGMQAIALESLNEAPRPIDREVCWVFALIVLGVVAETYGTADEAGGAWTGWDYLELTLFPLAILLFWRVYRAIAVLIAAEERVLARRSRFGAFLTFYFGMAVFPLTAWMFRGRGVRLREATMAIRATA